MNKEQTLAQYARQVEALRAQGNYKAEHVLISAQGGHIDTRDESGLVNMCANNYLGLSNHPQVVAAAKASYEKWGYGLSSVRFICGTQQVHKELEKALSAFLGMEDTILYSSCFDANTGLFETLLGEEDAIISDMLNHASIIDGIRLCKAQRYRYQNNDMEDLERQLRKAQGARIRLVATDGVFSMDGTYARLDQICELAQKYEAFVMVDDSHAVGFTGEKGAGTPEFFGVQGKVDILTGTLGKAMGGASGGYVSARREIVALLQQRSRPYLFSNTLAPAIAEASLCVLDLLQREEGDSLRRKLRENTDYFRREIAAIGFDVVESSHPIVAIMLYDAERAVQMARKLYEQGIYAVGFSYPVVPQGKARIRTQVSAAHSREDLARALAAFRAMADG